MAWVLSPFWANRSRRKTHLFLETPHTALQTLCCQSWDGKESPLVWPSLYFLSISPSDVFNQLFTAVGWEMFSFAWFQGLFSIWPCLRSLADFFLWAHLYLKFSSNLKVLETFMKMTDCCLTGSISRQALPWQIKPVWFEWFLHLCQGVQISHSGWPLQQTFFSFLVSCMVDVGNSSALCGVWSRYIIIVDESFIILLFGYLA